eukprot:g30880.t1
MSLTPGCQGAPVVIAQAAPGGPHANAEVSTTLPPHYKEVREDPTNHEGIAGCQARCHQSLGCGFFSFRRNSGRCQLHPLNATCVVDPEAIAGPPLCIARFQARVASVDFGLLSKVQLTNLHASLPNAFAQHWHVPSSKVLDVEGKAGAVTLMPGSLLAEGKVLLPAGTAVADIEKASDQGKNLELRKEVSKIFLSMDVPYEPDIGSSDVEASILPSRAKEGTSEKRMCVESGVCEVFSFFANSHQCFLQGGNLRAVHNEDAVSGPAKCPSIPHVRARAWADQLPGEIAAESKAAMDAIEKVPAPYLILACLLMLVLMVFCIMRCCRSQGKGKG